MRFCRVSLFRLCNVKKKLSAGASEHEDKQNLCLRYNLTRIHFKTAPRKQSKLLNVYNALLV